MSNETTAVIKNGQLVITLPWDKDGAESGSGKSIVHASTRGATQVAIDKKIVNISVNAYIKR